VPDVSLHDFSALGAWGNAAVFLAAAAVVWVAGTGLASADGIARRTGLGHAFVGMALLGGITSLPEMATSAASAHAGSPELAVNNVLGSTATNLAILALADVAVGRGVLTARVGSPAPLLQGVLSVLALALAGIAAHVADVPLCGRVGVWTAGLAAISLLFLWLAARAADSPGWVRAGPDPHGASAEAAGEPPSMRALALRTAAASAAILAAGVLLSRSGEALAEATGLGQGFFGAVLVAFATSLPELSSVFAAVRLGRHAMAVGDVFGTNIFNVGILLATDLAYADGPVLTAVGDFAVTAALVATALSAVVLAGLLLPRGRRGGVGLDAAAALLVYAGGVALLYGQRGG